ncbi:MAG: hypothetical protein HeimC2_15600 [Candidatus Heimdallarchaeota archaeon LC_2]|nr:MAG: hypothetical protein HeimC2_15600 [Candidatus Heimdallarchaeota archaeon LC_2]
MDPDNFVSLGLHDLIRPTIRQVGSQLVNAIEFLCAGKYSEITLKSDNEYIFRTIQHDILDGMLYTLTNMTFSISDTFANQL